MSGRSTRILVESDTGSSIKIGFEKTLTQEELAGSYTKKGPLPVVYYEGQHWIEEGGKPRWYATIKEVNEGQLSLALVERIENLLAPKGVEIGGRNTEGDTTFLYSPAPDSFSLDLRVTAFSNDIVFAAEIEERRRLDDVRYKGLVFTHMVPHFELGTWVEVHGTAKFQNPDANASRLIEVLGILGYKISQ